MSSDIKRHLFDIANSMCYSPYMTDNKKAIIAANIKTYRGRVGLSLSELSRQSQISKGYLSQIENEEIATPSADILFKIAGVLGVTIADILGERMAKSQKKIPFPPSLNEAISKHEEMRDYADMLVCIKMRGQYPKNADDWFLLFNNIKRIINPSKK